MLAGLLLREVPLLKVKTSAHLGVKEKVHFAFIKKLIGAKFVSQNNVATEETLLLPKEE